MKLTKRKGFNFFRSYYDVYNELEKDVDKLAFIDALLNKQFQGVDPEGLKGMAKFAWISQINSIDSQVKGWETKTGLKFTPRQGGVDTPSLQVQVEGKGKGEVQYSRTDPRITPPSEYDFRKYCYESIVGTFGKNSWSDKVKGNVINQFKYWSEANWSDGKGKIIKNWQQKARGSFKYFMK